MKTGLKSLLTEAIQKTLDTVADRRPELWHDDAYVHPELADHMADAAEAVFDATVASSKYTEEQSANA